MLTKLEQARDLGSTLKLRPVHKTVKQGYGASKINIPCTVSCWERKFAPAEKGVDQRLDG
jgi:hypothetical protein